LRRSAMVERRLRACLRAVLGERNIFFDFRAICHTSRLPRPATTGSAWGDVSDLLAGWSVGREIYGNADRSQEALERRNRRNDIIDEVAPIDGEPVMRKDSPSAFWGTPLIGHLTAHNVDTIIAVGETTSGCVRASVLDGCTNRFRMIVVEEGVFDRHEAAHAINLFDMNQKYADVLPLADVLEYLGEVGAKRGTAV